MTKPIALLALPVLVLAACGSTKDPAAGGPDDSDASRGRFEQCLRDNGVDVRSDAGGSGRATRITFRAGKGPGSPARFQKIQQDCMKKAGFKPQPPSQAQQAEMRDGALRFARCMRAHGIDLPDPRPGPGGGMLEKGPIRVSPRSARFQAAQKACGRLMPGGVPVTKGR